jgi:hypothetical protein
MPKICIGNWRFWTLHMLQINVTFLWSSNENDLIMQSQLIVKPRKHDNLFFIIILTIHLLRLVLAYEVFKGSTCINQTSS